MTAPKKRYTERPLDRWNVRDFHDWLIAQNAERFDASYVPFGKGPIGERWKREMGQLKQAQAAVGNAALHRFIERCLEKHRPKRDFPHVNFGFMWTYMRDELPRAQADVQREVAEGAAEQADMTDFI